MTTPFDQLRQLCPPPANPPAVDWHAVQDTLGFALPDDYKQVATAYGPGSFCDFLSLRHPLGATDWIDLTGPMTAVVQQQIERDRQRERFVPHPSRDLFPIAVSDNGEYVFWHTAPANTPNAWTLTVKQRRRRRPWRIPRAWPPAS